MFLLDIDNIRVDRSLLSTLEEKKNKLFRYLVYEKQHNNLKLFRTYLKSLLRLQDLMNLKSAAFESNSKQQAEFYYKNLIVAWNYIIDEVIENRTISDQKSLLYLHYLVDPEAHAKSPSQTRKADIMVGGHEAPEPTRLYSLVENMLFNGAEISNSVVRAIYYHHELVRIHPFIDGNGRVARLIENWILMYDLYPPMIISTVKERHTYIKNLDSSFSALTENPNTINQHTTEFFNNQMRRLNNSLDYLYTRLKL
jgi:Fic family protein